MNKYLICALLVALLLSISPFTIFAQQAPNNPIDGAVTDPAPQTPVQPRTVTATQRVTTSNRLCVKVGEARNEDKPANCDQPGSTSTGATGNSPIRAGAAPTVAAGQLTQTIKEQFGVTLQGAWDEQSLQWFYEKMYQVRQTNPTFAELVRDERIELIPRPPASIGPNQLAGHVQMTQGYAEGEKFMGTLIHELSHVIYHNRTFAQNLKMDHADIYRTAGAVTKYGESNITENYPEMISYCLTKRPVGELMSQERWETYYKPLAEKITGGSCL